MCMPKYNISMFYIFPKSVEIDFDFLQMLIINMPKEILKLFKFLRKIRFLVYNTKTKQNFKKMLLN